MIDLHCHTTASDGLLTPTELVELAASRSVEAIAVTDHDTTAGIGEAVEAAERLEVRVVPGIEMSTRSGERNVHILGYFLRPDEPTLLEAVTALRADRFTRAERIVQRLAELGYGVSMDDVREQAGDAKMIVRPHIARALVAKGYIATVRDAFTSDLIADGGLADVPKTAMLPDDAVALIRKAGGAAVIAHAAVGHHDSDAGLIPVELIEQLAAAGLAGVEIDHPDHPPIVRDELRAIAGRLGLVQTGGSDFHGEIGHVLGSFSTTPEALEALEAAAGKQGRAG